MRQRIPYVTVKRTATMCYIRVAVDRGAGAPVVGRYQAVTEAQARLLMNSDAGLQRRFARALKAKPKPKPKARKPYSKRNKVVRLEWFRQRRVNDPAWRLNCNIRAAIYKTLRGGKRGQNWSSLVGFSLADLRAHLEAQFVPGMSWENMGEWHVDHIRPLASFHFDGTADCPAFKAAWALSNLQPLWKADNLKKGAKW